MGWNRDREFDRNGRPAEADPAKRVLHFRPAPAYSEAAGVTAIELIHQAAQMMQSVEDHAAETSARAHDLARRAAEQLDLSEARIRSLEMAQRAAAADVKTANARTDEAEQMARATEAQIASMEDRLSAAEHRAAHAEARAIEAEKALVRVENAIRNQLLAQRESVMGRSAAA